MRRVSTAVIVGSGSMGVCTWQRVGPIGYSIIQVRKVWESGGKVDRIILIADYLAVGLFQLESVKDALEEFEVLHDRFSGKA